VEGIAGPPDAISSKELKNQIAESSSIIQEADDDDNNGTLSFWKGLSNYFPPTKNHPIHKHHHHHLNATTGNNVPTNV
jgi:hypothetical protein